MKRFLPLLVLIFAAAAVKRRYRMKGEWVNPSGIAATSSVTR
jgi:hypothetical protein